MENKFILPNQRPGEKILLLLRRHWFVMFLNITRTIILSLVPILFYIFLRLEAPNIIEGQISYPLLLLSTSIYYLFIWMFLYNNFIDYYLDVWIVTNQRIVNIEQVNLFNRVVSEKKLDRMQDITSEVKGMIQTFMNFGTIRIQTAGTTERFVFKDVPDAPNVTQQIIKIAEEYKEQNQADRKEEVNNISKGSGLMNQ